MTFLRSPKIDKETRVDETTDLQFGLSSMQGWRERMEDADITETHLYAISEQHDGSTNRVELPGHSLFAVLDGHGLAGQGTFSAQYSALNLTRVLCQQSHFAKYALALQDMQDKKFSDESEKSGYMSKNLLPHLESAFKQTFVTLDFEIGVAVVGKPVKEAVFPPDMQSLITRQKEAAVKWTNETTLESMNPLDVDNSGTTACCVLVTPDLLLCANAGDSRAVLYKRDRTGGGNAALPLSFDHKPGNEEEKCRILKAGGTVTWGGLLDGLAVSSCLAVSRGLGDFEFKHWPTVIANCNIAEEDASQTSASSLMHPGDQKVSPIPDFQWYPRDVETDKFLIVACDGIWDVYSNLQCAELVESLFSAGVCNLGVVCEKILESCLLENSLDNMTALVVKFPAQEVGPDAKRMKKASAVCDF